MPRVAVVQMESRALDPAHNLRRILDWLKHAAAQGSQLVVFPECALTGYFLTADEARSIAEAVPGRRTDRLAEACRQWGVVAVVGTIEKDDHGHCFNTAVMVGGDGVIGRYRKSHLICLGVDRHLTAGETLPEPFATPLGRLGMLICYDLRFPEPARILALAGAQAILLPTAWPQAATLYPDHVARTRSAENGVFILAADHVGEERGARYLGRSLIVGPDGEVLAEAGRTEETMLIADLDFSRSDQKHRIFKPGEYEIDLLEDRRPDLYRPITGSTRQSP
ncbi:MAG: carbon-nitrogen hydrolase family protein [Chloroflexota bacterium]